MNILGPAPESEPLPEDKGLLSDQIRRALADEIATGRLKPGTALDEQQIATRFGASRTPVREALRQLDVSGTGGNPAPAGRDRGADDARADHGHVRDDGRGGGHVRPAGDLPDHSGRAQPSSGPARGIGRHGRRFRPRTPMTNSTGCSTKRSTARPTTSSWRNRRSASGPAFRPSGAPSYATVTGSSNRMRNMGRSCGPMARGDGGEAARCMRAHMLNASGALTSYIRMLNDSDPLLSGAESDRRKPVASPRPRSGFTARRR